MAPKREVPEVRGSEVESPGGSRGSQRAIVVQEKPSWRARGPQDASLVETHLASRSTALPHGQSGN